MANNLMQVSKKLILALNSRGDTLTLSTKQFIGTEGQPHNFYSLCRGVKNERGKYINQELYGTTSMVRMTLYLRDMWYKLNDWELPTDQEKWNEIREQLAEKEKG